MLVFVSNQKATQSRYQIECVENIASAERRSLKPINPLTIHNILPVINKKILPPFQCFVIIVLTNEEAQILREVNT